MATTADLTPLPDDLGLDRSDPAMGIGGVPRTVTAIMLGLVICVAVNYLAVRSYVLFHRYSGFADHFNTVGAIFLLFWVTVIGLVLRLFSKPLGLRPGQFALVYAMTMIGTVLPTMGFGGYFLPMLAGVHYYASPENAWADLLWPHVPDWVWPSDPTISTSELVRRLFEGKPEGTAIPWAAWLPCMAYWSLLMVAFFLLSIGLVTLFWNQWVHRERLTFPLAALPTAMADSFDPQKPSIFKSKLFWIAFLVATWITLQNWAVTYFDFQGVLKPIRLAEWIRIPSLNVSSILAIDFIAMGIAYLLPADVLLSIWLFYVVLIVEAGLLGRFGVTSGVPQQIHDYGTPLVATQQIGALVFLVLYFFWLSRSYIRQAFSDAWHNRWDGTGIVSPRASLGMAVVGFVGMSVFTYLTGMRRIEALLLFMVFTVVIFFGTARLLAQTGYGRLRAACTPGAMLTHNVGAGMFGEQGLVAMGLSFVWSVDVQLFIMGTAPHGMKVCRERRVHKWLLVGAMCLALVVCLAVVCWTYMTLGHEHGLINGFTWYFRGSPNYHWNWVSKTVTDMRKDKPIVEEARPKTNMFFGIGAAAAAVVAVAHHRIPRWPLHPVGLAIASTNTVRHDWVNIFLVWVFKLLVLRYGGPPLYRKLIPLFLGMILGGCFGVGLSALIGSLEPA